MNIIRLPYGHLSENHDAHEDMRKISDSLFERYYKQHIITNTHLGKSILLINNGNVTRMTESEIGLKAGLYIESDEEEYKNFKHITIRPDETYKVNYTISNEYIQDIKPVFEFPLNLSKEYILHYKKEVNFFYIMEFENGNHSDSIDNKIKRIIDIEHYTDNLFYLIFICNDERLVRKKQKEYKDYNWIEFISFNKIV